MTPEHRKRIIAANARINAVFPTAEKAAKNIIAFGKAISKASKPRCTEMYLDAKTKEMVGDALPALKDALGQLSSIIDENYPNLPTVFYVRADEARTSLKSLIDGVEARLS